MPAKYCARAWPAWAALTNSGRGLGLASRQLEHEPQVVTRVLLLRIGGEHAPVGVDGAADIALSVAHDAEHVPRLQPIGLHAQHALELLAGGRPFLPRDQRRGQRQAGVDGVRLPPQRGPQLLDRAVEITEVVERLAERRPGGDEIWLQPQRLPQRRRRGGHLAAGDERLTTLELGAGGRRGRRGLAG